VLVTKGRRYRLVGASILLIAIALVLFPRLSPKEPTYGGKPMSDWIWKLNEKPEGPEHEEVRAIVRKLGSTHVPLLLQWLQEEDKPSLKQRFDNTRESVLFWLIRHKIIANRSFTSTMSDSDRSQRAMAMWALPELEPAAKKQAIPILIRLFQQKKPTSDEASDNANTALYVISKMAPESIPPLIDNLTNQDYQIWVYSASALGMSGPEAKSAIPQLQQRLNDSDYRIRFAAAYNILEVGGDPAICVPVIIGTLRDFTKDPGDIEFPIGVLLKHPEHAKPAIPILTEILNTTTNKTDPDSSTLRDDITRALQKLQEEQPASH